MTTQELKKFILTNNKTEYILQDLGCHDIVFHSSKNSWSATQPDGNNKMGVIIKNTPYMNYYSYSRSIDVSEGQDIFNLIQTAKNIKFVDAVKYVHKLLGLQYKYAPKKEPETPKFDPLAIFKRAAIRKRICNVNDIKYMDETALNDFYPYIHIDLFREGIIEKTIKKFGLCYSYRMKRTVFPHRMWCTGELLGYNARTSILNYEEFGISKYFITPGMNKTNNLYGCWENMKDIEEQQIIVLGESEKSVLKRDSRNDSTWVALSGKTISEEQRRIILGLDVKEIVICLDNDVPEVEVWSICEKFFRLRKVSYIKDRWGLIGEKDSAADAPNKIYDFMFRHRIEYTEKEHQNYLRSLKKK